MRLFDRGWLVVVAGLLMACLVSGCRHQISPATPLRLRLIEPRVDADVKQNRVDLGCPDHSSRGHGYAIRFSWKPARGITQYRLYVSRAGSSYPLIDLRLAASTYTLLACNQFVTESNRLEWQWRVEGFNTADKRIATSALRSFHFGPCTVGDGQPCRAPLDRATATP